MKHKVYKEATYRRLIKTKAFKQVSKAIGKKAAWLELSLAQKTAKSFGDKVHNSTDLGSLFVWHQSKQGHDFWADIHFNR